MKKARIKYNHEEDKYEIQINTGDGWGLDTAYKCVAKAGQTENKFISYTVLIKLQELQFQGYQIDFKQI